MAIAHLTSNDKLVLSGFAVLMVCISVVMRVNKRRRLHYPPGPPPHFLWGNFFDLPKEKPYARYAEWSKTYGSDIVHVESLGQHIVVLNSKQVASELLEKRSLIYSDRDSSHVMNATNFPAWAMGFSKYGGRWKDMRRVGWPYIKEDAADYYRPAQVARAAELLHNLLNTPEDFERHARVESTGTIMSLTYGYDVESRDDPFVVLANNALRALSKAVYYPRSIILNELALFVRLPSWVPSQRNLSKTQRLSLEMRDTPFLGVQKDIREGKSRDSIVTDLLSRSDGDSEKEMGAIRDFASSWYIGGADTTPSVICSFVLLMTLHPDVQKTVQAELDRVVGTDRLPDFVDRPNLPYLEAVVRETIRCAIVAPTSMGHVSSRDDEYNGYFIPKGTTVLANLWAMNNDEAFYPDPSKFDPTRHLSPEGEFCGEKKLADSTIFGHGRRKCPGRHMVDGGLWITMAYLLAAMDMKASQSEHARKLDGLEYIEGLTYQLKPFDCDFTPRSEKFRALILESLA